MLNLFKKKYKNHKDVVIIACYFNPQNSPYRKKVFDTWYQSIKHLNHRIVECVQYNAESYLSKYNDKHIYLLHNNSVLWHKESLLNWLIKNHTDGYKYIVWSDTDILFKNLNWMGEVANSLEKYCNILQPFSVCYHLEKDKQSPSFNQNGTFSFSRNWVENRLCGQDSRYDVHGHVGFCWAARREILVKVPLYDKCLVGGADHIIAHAATGQIPFECITKAFKENIKDIEDWQRRFYNEVKGKVGYIGGDLYHLWHGDVTKRKYLKRITEFDEIQKDIVKKDNNGLHIGTKNSEKYVKTYMKEREVPPEDDGFITSAVIGYFTNNWLFGSLFGGNLFGGIVGDTLNTTDDNKSDFS